MRRVQSAKVLQRDNKPQPDAFVSSKNKVAALEQVPEELDDESQISCPQTEQKQAPEPIVETDARSQVIRRFKQID